MFRGSDTSNLPSSSVGVARAMSDMTISLISVGQHQTRNHRQWQRRPCVGSNIRVMSAINRYCRSATTARTVDGQYTSRARETTQAEDDVCRSCHDRFLPLLCPLEPIEFARLIPEDVRIFMDRSRHGCHEMPFGMSCQSYA